VTKPLRVLIVEDSEDDAEIIVYQLERGGYAPIYQRVDNASAMSLALEQQQWDIVLADHSLPRFSGTAALALLQEKGLDLPFIIISGSIGDEIAVAAMKAGAHDYLMKGNLSRLVPAIERELQEATSRRERQRIQSELRESEDRWQLALRGANDGIWDWNIKTSEVFFSPRWKEMLGYAEDEIADRFDAWAKLVHPDDAAAVNQALQDHFGKKTQFYSTEHRLLCKDGSYKWILSRGQVLWDDAGNAIRMIGSHTDISATKQMEAKLRQQAESLAQANRIKDEFLAVISHELRTPLNSILGWSQMLRSRKFDEAAVVRALETIERNAKLQKQLIEDLLDTSRMIQGQFNIQISQISLVPIVEAAIETIQAAAQAKAIELNSIIDDSVGLVNGDANRLQQVLWNLVSNAVKFTPAGGRVEVRLSNENSQVEIRNSQSKQQQPITDQLPITNYAQIQVIDTGIGIKAKFLPYVFDRFRQEDSSTTRSYSGLGIGLAIAHHLVELHGGTIEAYSAGEGKGATFIVRLPLLEARQGDKGTRGQGEENITFNHSPLEGLQILVVDDDADNREFMVFALTTYGANAIATASSDEALRALQQFKPDVLLSDIGMPDEDGYALIRQVRMLDHKSGGNIPAIAVTGYTRDSDRNQALTAGFQLHLSKPIQPIELVAAIAKLCRRNALFQTPIGISTKQIPRILG
jgi:PAS domain S-box-containing protein